MVDVYDDFGGVFRFADDLLSYILINPYRQFAHPLTGWKYGVGVVQFWVIFASILLIVGGEFWYIYDAIRAHSDIVSISFCMNWMIFGVISVECMLMIHRNGHRTQLIMECLNDIFRHLKARPDVEFIGNYLSEKIEPISYFVIVYKVAKWIMVLAGPIWRGYGYIASRHVHVDSVLLLKYPTHSENIYWSLAIFLWETWAIIATAQLQCGYLALLAAITIHINLNFQLLIRDFEALDPHKNANATDNMVRLARQHDEVLRIADEIRSLYSSSLLINYMLNSIAMCSLIFVIVNSPDPIPMAKALAVLIAFYYYNIAFSYYGNELITTVTLCSAHHLLTFRHPNQPYLFQSGAISNALYDSNWTAGTVNHQKLMIMMMRRASKPASLSGMGFFTVSFESFSRVSLQQISIGCFVLDIGRKSIECTAHPLNDRTLPTVVRVRE